MIRVARSDKRVEVNLNGDAATICADLATALEEFVKVYSDTTGTNPKEALADLSAAITETIMVKWAACGYES